MTTFRFSAMSNEEELVVGTSPLYISELILYSIFYI